MRIHLSPYNILWTGEDYRIIDFPQAVDPRFNGNAQSFLQRDIENVGGFCARFAGIPDPRVVALEIWSRFQCGGESLSESAQQIVAALVARGLG